MAILKREYGKEQPHWKVGIFKVRLPFIHFDFTGPEIVTGLCNSITSLAAIATLVSILGIEPTQAWAVIIISTLCYCLHWLLGDASVGGWVTPALAVVTVFLTSFPEGSVRMQAMSALQIELAIIFLVLGFTGLARKLTNLVPPALKAGIILGAAIAAAFGQLKEGANIFTFPVTVTIGSLIVFFLMFSSYFRKHVNDNIVFQIIGRFTFAVGVVICLIVGGVVGEIDFSSVDISKIFAAPDFIGAFKTMSPFSIGFPNISIWLQAAPIAIVAYVIAFGDFVTLKQLGLKATRDDELVDYNSNRSSVISGIRNLVLGLLTPFPPLAGPMSAPYAVSTFQRYKTSGQEGMDSIWNGYGSNMIFAVIGLFFYPLYSVALAGSGAILAVLVMIQGYVCTQVAFDITYDKIDQGIAGMMAGAMVAGGGRWCLGVGLVLYFLLADPLKIRSDYAKNHAEAKAEDEKFAVLEKK